VKLNLILHMAEFLNKKKLLEWIPKIIETAEKEIIIN